jgi:hypothetical protein
MLRAKLDVLAQRMLTPSWQVMAAWTGLALVVLIVLIALVAVASSQAEGVLRGIAELVKALAWPAAVIFVIAAFRQPISNQIARVNKVIVPGGSIELGQIIDSQLEHLSIQAKTRSPEQIGTLSPADFERARVIGRAATAEDLPEIRSRLVDLATEYRRVRGAMPFGNDRTRALSLLVAEMRALGQAAYALRGEFAFSDDPGRRLAAVTIAQVQPDPSMFGWLATRIGPSERPFVQYHALQGLLVAARNADASQAISLGQAYRIALRGYEELSSGERTDRRDLLDELGDEVSRLRSALKAVE